MQSRKMRPQSVVDNLEFVEDVHRNEAGGTAQLDHPGKSRPRRYKTKAPTRPTVNAPGSPSHTEDMELTVTINEGVEEFFLGSRSAPVSPAISPVVPVPGSPINPAMSRSMIEEPVSNNVPPSPTKDKSAFLRGLSMVLPRTSAPPSDKHQRSVSVDESATSSPSAPKPSAGLAPVNEENDVTVRRAAIAKRGVGMGVDVLAEMKARQEKRMSSLYKTETSPESPDTATGSIPDLSRTSVGATDLGKVSSSTPGLSEAGDPGASSDVGFKSQPVPAQRTALPSPSRPIPVQRSTESTPEHLGTGDRRASGSMDPPASPSMLQDRPTPPLKPKPPPPIAPKPRPRSVAVGDKDCGADGEVNDARKASSLPRNTAGDTGRSPSLTSNEGSSNSDVAEHAPISGAEEFSLDDVINV